MALQSEEVLCVAGDAPAAATQGAHAVFLNISNWPFRCVRKRGGGIMAIIQISACFPLLPVNTRMFTLPQ